LALVSGVLALLTLWLGIAERVGKLEANQRNIGSILDVLVDEIQNMKALPPPSKRKIGFDLQCTWGHISKLRPPA
jgi:hypothetical protein